MTPLMSGDDKHSAPDVGQMFRGETFRVKRQTWSSCSCKFYLLITGQTILNWGQIGINQHVLRAEQHPVFKINIHTVRVFERLCILFSVSDKLFFSALWFYFSVPQTSQRILPSLHHNGSKFRCGYSGVCRVSRINHDAIPGKKWLLLKFLRGNFQHDKEVLW